MALRFNKRFKIAPGVKINLSKTGVSTTVGVRGASVNIGKKGVHANAGIPGTGLSTRTKIAGGGKPSREAERQVPQETSTGWAGKVIVWGILGVGLVVIFAAVL